MKIVAKNLGRWALARLSEGSTYVGFVAFLVSIGVAVPDSVTGAAPVLGAMLASMVAGGLMAASTTKTPPTSTAA